jgi:NADPH-dependent 2,4-dienoyl-CoA reductase/sulfur reductase-like enzyme
VTKNAQHVRGEVTGVNPAAHSVSVRTVAGADVIVPYDFLVLAPGCKFNLPAKAYSTDSAESKSKLAEARAAVAAARRITIVGGGAVGCELAGEIKQDLPDKEVKLIHSSSKLLSSSASGPLSDAFKERALANLRALGVEVTLGQRVTRPTLPAGARTIGEDVIIGTVNLSLANGTTVESDVTFFTTGGRPNTDFLQSSLGKAIDVTGFINVNAHMQVQGYTDIFAIGDVTNLRETKTAYGAASQHVPRVVKNILALVHAKERPGTAPTLVSYTPPPLGAMFLTAGRNGGAGQVGKTLLGPRVVKMLKSKGLFVGMYNKTYGYSKPGEYPDAPSNSASAPSAGAGAVPV